jgi:hypothetical protein
VPRKPRARSELARRVLKRAAALLECEEAGPPPTDGIAVASLTAGEGQAGLARSRAILYLGREVSIQPEVAGQCERSVLLVRLSRPSGEISTTKFAQETGCCHLLSEFSGQNSTAAALQLWSPVELRISHGPGTQDARRPHRQDVCATPGDRIRGFL